MKKPSANEDQKADKKGTHHTNQNHIANKVKDKSTTQ